MEIDLIQFLSVALGGFLTITATIFVELLRESRKGRSIESAILAEIESITKFLEDQKIGGKLIGPTSSYYKPPEYILPDNYSNIYKENLHEIGLIENNLATKIIKFYQLIESVKFDLSDPDFRIDAGERNLSVINRYKSAQNISKDILKKHRKKSCKHLNFKSDKNPFSVEN